MIEPALITQVRHLQLKVSHSVTSDLSGSYMSAFKGQGMEFQEVREYSPGDDVRRIDWNVTARAGTPFIKVFREERELTLMLIIDVSRSMEFGSGERVKREWAAEIGAILALLAVKNNDKVGVILCGDGVEHYIPPRKGRGHIFNIIRSVLSHKPRGTGTNLSAAFSFLLKTAFRRTLTFVISDFRDPQMGRLIPNLVSRHSITFVQIQDHREMLIPAMGTVMFEDIESGFTQIWPTDSSQWRTQWQHGTTLATKQWHQQRQRWGIDCLEINQERKPIAVLTQYLRRKQNRVRG